MNRFSLALPAALVVSAAGATGSAAAATLSTDALCYPHAQEVVVSGAGFAPLSAVTISRDGVPLGTAQADADGAFRNSVPAARLPRDVRERLHSLSATDLTSTALTSYRATRIFAGFTPRSGNPLTLNVRFTVNGFGLQQRRSPVYLHYVRPDGRAARTIKLGTATGVCGKITARVSKQRRLFGFEAVRGRWILQFDTRRRYERATSKRRTPWVRKPVEIFSRSR